MNVVARLMFAAALAMLVVLPSRPTAQATPGITRSVYVNAFDEKGDPVEDLAPADFVVKEGGKAREVRAYHPAKGLMQIALIVDDNGSGLFARRCIGSSNTCWARPSSRLSPSSASP